MTFLEKMKENREKAEKTVNKPNLQRTCYIFISHSARKLILYV